MGNRLRNRTPPLPLPLPPVCRCPSRRHKDKAGLRKHLKPASVPVRPNEYAVKLALRQHCHTPYSLLFCWCGALQPPGLHAPRPAQPCKACFAPGPVHTWLPAYPALGLGSQFDTRTSPHGRAQGPAGALHGTPRVPAKDTNGIREFNVRGLPSHWLQSSESPPAHGHSVI